MAPDMPTLMLTSAFVSQLCGAFLILTWWENRQPAVLWWAAADLALGTAVALLAIGFVNHVGFLYGLGLTLIIVSTALLWSGIRSFYGSPIRWLVCAAGPALWLAAAGPIDALGYSAALNAVHSLIASAYLCAAIWELTKHRVEVLRARKPLIVLIAVNIFALLLAIPSVLLGELQALEPPPLMSFFGLIHLESLIFVVGTTVFLVALQKERSERKNLQDAETDALTGLANRRAFLPLAERVADRCRRQGEPYAVAVFDLDRFKRVNDTFGHPFGDEVLRIFARVARETLRPGDLMSRVGGEEFFAILPGANLKEGCGTAERVCRAFEEAGIRIEGRSVEATVSAGVMASDDASTPLAKLLERADAALYRAKVNGRNCVQCGLEEPDQQPYPRLVNVA